MFAAGQQVTVHRTDGTVEDDWYCWTDFTLQGNVDGYTPPECIAVSVVKPLTPFTAEDINPNPDVRFIEKRVSLSTLAGWNQEDQTRDAQLRCSR